MVGLEQIRNQSFPLKTKADWEAKAEQSLKGKTVQTLHNSTYENIILKPLYLEDDEISICDYPGGSDGRRGNDLLGYVTKEWKVAQQIPFKDLDELKSKLSTSVKKGQTAISFELTNEVIDHFSSVTDSTYPFAINAKWLQPELVKKLDSKGLTGYIANDPLALFAEEGAISEDYLQTWTNAVLQAAGKQPQLRTVLIDTVPYHNGGANAVQELGIAAATAVFYVQHLTNHGLDLETSLSKFMFQFSIGSNFFMEVAKLRAARVLWNRITELYGTAEEARNMQITAKTSSFNKTLFDPHVNILRSANEAFAAILGGVQYLQIGPFDELTGSNLFSERIARNIQLILKDEAHLQKVIDPAGGSWYIESLTNQLAEAAWVFFQQIDARNGILEALRSGWVQKEITAVFEKRNKDIQMRKQSIIGTNVYAKLDEPIPVPKMSPQPKTVDSSLKIEKIPQRRLAEPYEELRFKAKQLPEEPAVGLLCLGELKQHKARKDFIQGFLAPGGIDTVESQPIFTLEDARLFLSGSTVKYLCFCGTNDQYEVMGHELLFSLKAEFPERIFLLAGLPERERQQQWLEEGIQQFIHLNSNCFETATAILTQLEVKAVEDSKA
ncbi:methylmalonyl-CoA mutase subunit beta [Bacillus sp. JJ1764]|uniref:methylmalonyl-CoA mutase subunit beta n=1 Tax=Bacillus sp. JJ1764 TaxID=3122964 RepID=UPI002FFDCE9E